MTILRPMDQQGSYIPFEKPVPVPSSLADDEPLSHICFNSGWLPMILGALKVLCRPETWEGADVDIRSTIASAHDLIAAYESDCPAVVVAPNWYLDLQVSVGQFDTDVWYNPIYDVDSFGRPTAEYNLIIWGVGVLTPEFTIVGRDMATNDLVGGLFDSFGVANESDPAGQVFVLTITTCIDVTTVYNDFTPRTFIGNFKNLQFTGGNTTVYFFKITIVGDWICTVA